MQSTTPSAVAESLLSERPLRLEPRGGRSGARSFLVTTGAGRFMLKLDTGTDLRRWRSRTAIQRAAAELGITPSVVGVDASARAVLTTHIEDQSFTAAAFDPARSDAALAALVDGIAALHGLPTRGHERGESPLERIARTLAELPFVVPGFAAAVSGDLIRRDVTETFDTICHLDLNPSNVLFDGDAVWLVDWGTAGPGDRWLDLATVATMLLLSPQRTRWMLERYAAASGVGMPSPERFAEARRIVLAGYGCAFLALVDQPPGALPLGRRSLGDCFGALHAGRLDIDADAGRYQLAHAFFAAYREFA